MLGGFYVEKTVENQLVKSKVGSGFTNDERGFYWDIRDTLIGRIVEIKYQELTDDGSSLRFPVFSKLK